MLLFSLTSAAASLDESANLAGRAVTQETAKAIKGHYGCSADINQGGFVKEDLAVFWVVEVQCDRRTIIVDRIYLVQPTTKGDWTVVKKFDAGIHPEFTVTGMKIDGDSIIIEGYDQSQKLVQRSLDIVQK